MKHRTARYTPPVNLAPGEMTRQIEHGKQLARDTLVTIGTVAETGYRTFVEKFLVNRTIRRIDNMHRFGATWKGTEERVVSPDTDDGVEVLKVDFKLSPWMTNINPTDNWHVMVGSADHPEPSLSVLREGIYRNDQFESVGPPASNSLSALQVMTAVIVATRPSRIAWPK